MTQVRPGERLAQRYEILTEIGRGGMGAVFEAHDTVLERRVALKVVTGAGAASANFEHEAKLAAKLDHPAIVPVYDFGRDDGRLFFVMPIVEGLTLRQMLLDGPLPQVIAAVIVRQVAEALAHSHARGVVHRDIKPENVMVAPGTDGRPRVKVLDFGIAASAADAASGTPRQVVGTPDYLSPEQASGGPVDARSDVYALGVMLYECCAGVPPFVGDDVFKLIEAILRADPPRLSERCPGVERAFDDIVARCLAKDPADRPESAERVIELLADLTVRLRPSAPVGAPPRPKVDIHSSTLPAAPRIIGRQGELTRVRSRLDSAANGECQLIAIGGSYGVGKSAFVATVCEAAEGKGMLVLRGRFLVEDDDVTPYQAISDAIAGFFRTNTDGEEWFEEPGLLAQLVSLLPQLHGIVRLPENTPLAARATRAETFEVFSRALAALMTHATHGGRRGLLLVLEDIHAARTSIDAVRYMLRRLVSAPLAIVLTHRAGDADPEHPLFELRSALLGEPSFLDLELRPLERADSDALAATLLPGAKVAPNASARLFELTEGNPLHLAELTVALRESGQLRVEAGVWTMATDATSSPPVPASMRSVVERRLQRLSSSERAVLEAGTIFGRSFTYEDVAALGVPMIDAALERLIRGGLVHRESSGSRDRYLFSGVVVAETAREALGPGKRRALHKRFADHLVARGRAVGGEAARVVWHLMLAGERPTALAYAVRATSHALDAALPEDVFHVVGLVGEPEGNLTKADVELMLSVARAHEKTKNVDRARAITAKTLSLLERRRGEDQKHGDRSDSDLDSVEITALRFAAELAWRERQRGEALDLARRALALATALERVVEIEPIETLINAIEGPAGGESASGGEGEKNSFVVSPALEQELIGERLLVQGDYLAARELFDRADAHRANVLPPAEAARHALKSALLAHRLGSYDEAELIARSARQRVTTGPMAGEIDAAIALIHCSRGHYEVAWSVVQEAISTLGVTAAEQRVRALLLRAKGESAINLGRVADATDAYDQSGRLLDPLLEPLEHSAALFGSGAARIAAGKPDEAARLFERAEREKLAIGDRWGLAHVHEGLARVCLYKGRLSDAVSHAQRAVMLAAAIADPKLTASTRVRLGFAHLARGEMREARTAVDLALRDAAGCGAEPEIVAALVAVAEVHLEVASMDLSPDPRARAAEIAKEALQRASRLALPSAQLSALLVLARSQHAGATQRIIEATALTEHVGNPFILLDVALTRAVVEENSTAFDAVVERAAAVGAARHVGEALLSHARLWARRRSADRATPLFMQASAVFAEMGAPLRAEDALRHVE